MNKKELVVGFRTFKEDKKNGTCSFDTMALSEAYRGSDKYLCDYSFVFEFIRSLTGEMLTIVDAAIPQGVQNKCTKDLIRKSFGEKLQLLGELLLDQEDLQRQANEYEANGGEFSQPVDLQDIIDNTVVAHVENPLYENKC